MSTPFAPPVLLLDDELELLLELELELLLELLDELELDELELLLDDELELLEELLELLDELELLLELEELEPPPLQTAPVTGGTGAGVFAVPLLPCIPKLTLWPG